MPTGADLLSLAETRLKEKYVNVLVPKNNPNWHGPWDCAEFMSWLVYQIGGFLYGCIDNEGNPATTEAYTGAWQRDSKQIGQRVSAAEAAAKPGAILLRYPPSPGTMGHIAVSDGNGGTIEAMGKAYGVRRGKVSGRLWHTGVLIPTFTYQSNTEINISPPEKLYAIDAKYMNTDIVIAIQKSLHQLGIDPGPIDGIYGHNTTAAVAAFQAIKGLVVDGQVGATTAKYLKISF